MRIYLDNAATTPICERVLDAMLPYLRQHFGNPSSSHAEGRTSRAAIESARKLVAQTINGSTGEVFFTSGGTEANNTALKCAVRDLGVRHIITSPIEHSCVKNTVKGLHGQYEVKVSYVNLERTGRADLNHLVELLEQATEPTLVSLMHSNNELGTLNDITTIGNLCKKHNALFHTDTVQTIGHIPIDVKASNIHFLSGSAHKLHGPKGVGFLFVCRDNMIKPFIDGGGQERQIRSGTENVASIMGFAKALELAIEELDERREHIEAVRSYFVEQLKEHIPGVAFNGDYNGKYLYTVLSTAIPTTIPINMLLFQLDLKGVSASGGSACSSGAIKGSYVINTIGAAIEGSQTVRFSFSHFNTTAEVDQVIGHLKSILKIKDKVSQAQ